MTDKPLLHIILRPAAQGMKVEIIASPSIWTELAENGSDWSFDGDDTVLEVETRLELPIGQSLRPISVTTSAGADEIEDNLHALEWDDDEKVWMPASELNT